MHSSRLIILLVAAATCSARTVTLDASVAYINIGPGASCGDATPPVRGSPRLCLGQATSLLMGPLQISQMADGTTIFSNDGTTVAAFGVNGALSVGGSVALGTPGSITVVPQAMYDTIDGIWVVHSQMAIINAYVQEATLVGTTFNGLRVKSTLDNSSVVLLDTGQVVIDNGVNRNIVLGGIRSGATVVTQGSVFAPDQNSAPIVLTVPIPVDGQTRLRMTLFSSPSACGSALARQTSIITLDTTTCMALTSDMRSVLLAADQPVLPGHTGISFSACPAAGGRELDATVWTSADCSAGSTPVQLPLGHCIDDTAMFGCEHAI